MPFWRAYYHVIWGTKRRQHIITPELEHVLYPAIVRKAGEMGLYIYAIDGWTDHTHIVLTMPPKYALADIVGKLKGNSSHYVNDHNLVDFEFRWQRGYGGLTLGYSQLDRAIAYVKRQKQHHAKQTTNKWLEHIEEWDDGPLDSPHVYQHGTQIVKEPTTEYTTSSDWLFP